MIFTPPGERVLASLADRAGLDAPSYNKKSESGTLAALGFQGDFVPPHAAHVEIAPLWGLASGAEVGDENGDERQL
ncbi:MAG: hypothetical protein Q8P18_21600 [Pseudomonadota bacterium]|nr:hypothetical protein [Pseudomonadota bacterium]